MTYEIASGLEAICGHLYLTDPAQSDSEESVTFEFTRETAEE